MTTWQGLLDFALLTTTVNWLQCIYMHGHTSLTHSQTRLDAQRYTSQKQVSITKQNKTFRGKSKSFDTFECRLKAN